MQSAIKVNEITSCMNPQSMLCTSHNSLSWEKKTNSKLNHFDVFHSFKVLKNVPWTMCMVYKGSTYEKYILTIVIPKSKYSTISINRILQNYFYYQAFE